MELRFDRSNRFACTNEKNVTTMSCSRHFEITSCHLERKMKLTKPFSYLHRLCLSYLYYKFQDDGSTCSAVTAR